MYLLYRYKSASTDAGGAAGEFMYVCAGGVPEAVTAGLESKGTEFACFTGTKVQILTLGTSRAQASQHTSAYVC